MDVTLQQWPPLWQTTLYGHLMCHTAISLFISVAPPCRNKYSLMCGRPDEMILLVLMMAKQNQLSV